MDKSSRQVELFRVLYTAYNISKGHPKHPIIIQQLVKLLGIDMDDNPRYQYLLDLFVHLENEGLLRGESGLGTVITNFGIDEVESALLEPDKPTIHYPANISRFVDVDNFLIEFIRKIRKARKDYLYATYQAAGGLQTVVVNSFEVKNELKLEDEVFQTAYFYLEEAGLIEFQYIGGITITHQGKLTIEGEDSGQLTDLSFWSSPYPDITITDDIVRVIDRINSECKNKIGYEIFASKAKPISELRLAISALNRDSKNKAAYVQCMLSTGLILSEIDFDEIKKDLIDYDKINGPLNIIQALFDLKKIPYVESDFKILRSLATLRSITFPVHSAESKFGQILKSLNIQYPVVDWAETANTCLKYMLNSLDGLLYSIENTVP